MSERLELENRRLKDLLAYQCQNFCRWKGESCTTCPVTSALGRNAATVKEYWTNLQKRVGNND